MKEPNEKKKELNAGQKKLIKSLTMKHPQRPPFGDALLSLACLVWLAATTGRWGIAVTIFVTAWVINLAERVWINATKRNAIKFLTQNRQTFDALMSIKK